MENDKAIIIWQILLETTTGGFTRDEPVEYHTEDLGFFLSEYDALKQAKSYISEELKKELAYGRDFYDIVCDANWTLLKRLNEKDQLLINDKPVKVDRQFHVANGKHKKIIVKPVDVIDSLNTKDL
jgi:hypothetical protein